MEIMFQTINGAGLGSTTTLTHCPRIGETIVCPVYSTDNTQIGVNYVKVLNVRHNVKYNIVRITLDTNIKYDLFKDV